MQIPDIVSDHSNTIAFIEKVQGGILDKQNKEMGMDEEAWPWARAWVVTPVMKGAQR